MTTTRTAKQIINAIRAEWANLERYEQSRQWRALMGYGDLGALMEPAKRIRGRIRELERELERVMWGTG